MFAKIAFRYDLANLLLSFGVDRYWRYILVKKVCKVQPSSILDLATGSGDVALALARKVPSANQITGMDFCEPMLEAAREKKRKASDPKMDRLAFVTGDGMEIPSASETYDVTTISFGLRNMQSRVGCMREIRRVLKPGGTLFVLEFSQPYFWFSPFYRFYSRHILPRLAAWLTGDRKAYEYLNSSIEAFPNRSALEKECLEAGFERVESCALSFGIVALHTATKGRT